MQDMRNQARARWWARAAAAVIGDVIFAGVFFAVGEPVIGGLFLLLGLAVGMARENERRAFRAGWHEAHLVPSRRVAPQPWDVP